MGRRIATLAGILAALAASAAPAHAGAPSANGVCSWFVQSNADAVNVAFPDEGASYWATQMLQIPRTGLVIRGRFPHARYFSIHAYDPLLRPVGALRDDQIDPASGVNRFRAGEFGDGSYVIRIVPQARPANPAPNTIYAGAMHEGEANPGGLVLYRVYVPDDPSDPTGGVGLPDVSLSAGDGAAGVPFGQCDITGRLPGTGLNQAIAQADYPKALDPPATPRDTNPPQWSKFFGYSSAVGGAPVPIEGGGFLSNFDNDYMVAGLTRAYGDVVVFRALMPTFPDTLAGAPPWAPAQLRYWSVCQNETYTQRYVGCVADYQAALDGQGRATFVISDPADRPANADSAHGVNWLPWGGGYPDGRIIYRQMVAAPDFTQALARVQPGQDLGAALGPYLPRIAYCTKARFEQGGADACLG